MRHWVAHTGAVHRQPLEIGEAMVGWVERMLPGE
jgi:hypothetical protein